MKCQLIFIFFIGAVVSTYAYRLPDAQKRSLENDPRVLNLLNDFYAQVVYPPLNHIVTSLSLLGAQVLAGLSQTGIPAPNGRTFHPTEAQLRGFFDELWNNSLRPPLENAISGLSLMAAQLFAGIGTNGVNLGKRDMTEAEMRDFFDSLSQAMNNVFSNVIQKPLEDALSNGALMLAQVLAGMGTNGIDLSNMLGKRDMTEAEMRDFFDSLSQAMNNVFSNVIQKPLEDALSNGALMLAQVLAGIGTNGVDLGSFVGKRDLEAETRGEIIDNLLEHAQGLFSSQVKPAIENALNTAALHLAGVLANFSQNGFGRR